VAIVVDYEKFRKSAVAAEQGKYLVGSLVCAVLCLLSGIVTYAVIVSEALGAVILLAEAATLFLIITLGVVLFGYCAAAANKPAARASVLALTEKVDQLGNPQEFVSEISALWRAQGELYQYQVEALLEAIKKQGISGDIAKITNKINSLRQGLGI
jgi:hypothetical protein